MKIMAFSDLHLARNRAAELVAASAEADLVIGAGDYCNMRQGLAEAMDLLAALEPPVVLVPGNAESDGELRAAAPEGWTVLHGEGAELGGLRLFGLGGGIPPTPFGDWSFDLSEAQAQAALAPCEAADILITHSPPKGLVDVTSQGASVGSPAIRAAIERIRPRLALCGHIHDSWGRTGALGGTHVANLGPRPNWFDLTPKEAP